MKIKIWDSLNSFKKAVKQWKPERILYLAEFVNLTSALVSYLKGSVI